MKNKDRDEKGRFIAGHNAALKWTEDKIREKLQEVYQYWIDHPEITTPNELADCLEREKIMSVGSFIYLIYEKENTISKPFKKHIDFSEEGRIMKADMHAGIIAMVLKNKFAYKDRHEVEHSGELKGVIEYPAQPKTPPKND